MALVLTGMLAAGAPAGPARDAVARNADTQLRQLERVLTLARENSCYLVLDLRRAQLKLMLGGVTLRVIHYSQADIGTPRIAFLAASTPNDWADRVWSGGSLAPARTHTRREIAPPRPDAPQDERTPWPPLPAESAPPPHRYQIRFDGGLRLAIRRAGTTALPLSERVAMLFTPGRSRVRLGLTLSAEDADWLYRSLPSRVKLTVLGHPR